MEKHLSETKNPRMPRTTKLIYDNDGNALGMTEDDVDPGTLFIEVNRKDIEAKYGGLPNNSLKIVNGKLHHVDNTDHGYRINVVPGDKWNSDTEFRMITGQEADGDKDGWSKRDS